MPSKMKTPVRNQASLAPPAWASPAWAVPTGAGWPTVAVTSGTSRLALEHEVFGGEEVDHHAGERSHRDAQFRELPDGLRRFDRQGIGAIVRRAADHHQPQITQPLRRRMGAGRESIAAKSEGSVENPSG